MEIGWKGIEKGRVSMEKSKPPPEFQANRRRNCEPGIAQKRNQSAPLNLPSIVAPSFGELSQRGILNSKRRVGETDVESKKKETSFSFSRPREERSILID